MKKYTFTDITLKLKGHEVWHHSYTSLRQRAAIWSRLTMIKNAKIILILMFSYIIFIFFSWILHPYCLIFLNLEDLFHFDFLSISRVCVCVGVWACVFKKFLPFNFFCSTYCHKIYCSMRIFNKYDDQGKQTKKTLVGTWTN